MRYLRALGIFLGLVVLGIFAANRVDHRRGLSAWSPPRNAAKDLRTAAVLAQAGAPAAPEAEREEVATAGKAPPVDAVSPPSLSALKLIRSAEISLELERYEDGARAAEAIARSCEGYVSDSRSASATGGAPSGQLTLRIPAARFEEAFRRLAALGKIESRQIHTQDITREYFDLETRLRVERDAEARLREVLRNRTARLSDIVEAERELTRVVGEIERTEGEKLFDDRQVAFATITVELHQPGVSRTSPEPSPLQPLRTALHESLYLLSSSAAGLVYALAAGLPWAGVAALLWLLIRRIRARRSLRLAV
jgi:hypothetical protein